MTRGRKTGGASTDEELRRLWAGPNSWMRGAPFNVIEQVLGVPEVRIGQCKRSRDFVLHVANRSLYLIAAAFSELARETLTRLGRASGNPAALELLAVAIRKGFDFSEKIAFAHRSPSLRTRTAVHRDFQRRFGARDPVLGQSYEAILQHVDAIIAFDAFDRGL